MSRELIIAGVSGGVDSSVTALLLKQQGREVAGLFMKNWEEDDANGTCPAEADAADAEAVCAALGIAFHTRNFAAEYWDGVFEHFLAEHRAGRTPNPDVLCNREIKFKTFLEHAQDLGAQRIATGHYARIGRGADGDWQLLRARDGNKDQTYFLHALGQAQLAATEFPLGALTKPQVRAIARAAGLATAAKKDSTGICFIGERDFREFLGRYLPARAGEMRDPQGQVIGELPKPEVRRLAAEAGLPVHAKKDSTGICFIGERDFREFLAQYLPARPGPIRDPQGATVGEHPGVFYFTLGQREGLNIGGLRGRDPAPWYVVGKDVAGNVLYVDQGHDSPYLFSSELRSEPPTWTTGAPPATRFTCTAKTRYRQQDAECEVQEDADGGLRVRFATPQRAVTPGQSVVFYRDDECLGGAVIDRTDAPIPGQP